MIFASTPPINDNPFPGLGHRPEFDRPRAHEANPILVELRLWRGSDWARPERYAARIATMLRWADDPEASREDEKPWTDAQRSHARRVLTRLANFA